MKTDPTPRELLLQVMSDVYKDAHGVRPHGTDYSTHTLAELEREYAALTDFALKS